MILSSVQNPGWLMIINYTYDIQMLHFFCCFAKNILFQANGDNYCLLLRIGF